MGFISANCLRLKSRKRGLVLTTRLPGNFSKNHGVCDNDRRGIACHRQGKYAYLRRSRVCEGLGDTQFSRGRFFFRGLEKRNKESKLQEYCWRELTITI